MREFYRRSARIFEDNLNISKDAQRFPRTLQRFTIICYDFRNMLILYVNWSQPKDVLLQK